MITSTTDKELQGDGQTAPLESFNMCKRASENVKSDYKYVEHRCQFADMYNRCTRDVCYYSKDESPDVCNKHWVKCKFCGSPLVLPPNQMEIPICDSCLSLINQHLRLPFTCAFCGKSVNEYTAMPFTRLCNECLTTYVFHPSCARYLPGTPVELVPLDLP